MEIENSKLKIIFFGTPLFVVPVLQTLIDHFDVVGIITTPDVPMGRKKIMTPTPVKQAYENYLQQTGRKGLIIDTQHVNTLTREYVNNLKPDLFVVAAYGQLIPKSLLEIPTHGSLNIHPSLLPKYRGPSPIQSAILNGETTTGVTIIEMDEEIDHGPILVQKENPITKEDTFENMHVRLFGIAAAMLPGTIADYVNNRLKPIPQDHAKATYCEHITRQDGYFDLTNPPKSGKLDRMIRAYYPWPTTWTRVKTKHGETKIMKLLPGKKVQLEGGKPMSLKDLANGYPELKETIANLLILNT